MRDFIRNLCCATMLVSFAFGAKAQDRYRPIPLKTLLTNVGQKAPALMSDSAAVLIKKAEAVETRNNWLPDVKLNYQSDLGTNNNVAGPYFGFGLVPSDSRGVRTQNNSKTAATNLGIASFDWEVYNFGAYHAQNILANSNVKVEQSRFQQSKYELQAYTIEHYLELLRQAEFLTIQKKNIIRNQQIIRTVIVLAKSGLRPGVDTSIANAELSKARLVYIELQNQYRQEQQHLALISGFPFASILPDTTLEDQLIGRSNALAGVGSDSQNHPLIAYYQSLYQNSKDAKIEAGKRYNPKILLEGATWGRGSSIDGTDHFNSLSTGLGFGRSNYLVGLAVSYNLTDLRRRQLRMRTEKLAVKYAFKKLEEEKALLASTNVQADNELQTSMLRLDEIPLQLKAAQDAYRQKFSLYKNGLTDIIELDAALNILYRAEKDFSLAKNQFAFALFQKALTENQLSILLNSLN